MDFCDPYAHSGALYEKIQIFFIQLRDSFAYYTLGAKFWHEATFYTMTNLACFWNIKDFSNAQKKKKNSADFLHFCVIG